MTELRDFLGKQFDAVYEKTKTIQKAIDDTVEFLKPEQPSVERKITNCCCEEPWTEGVVHRNDGPCYWPTKEPQQKPKCACYEGFPHVCKEGEQLVSNPSCPCECHGERKERYEYGIMNVQMQDFPVRHWMTDQPPKEESYTKKEIDEKLKKVLAICEKRDGMHDTLNEIIYVDVKEEHEWRKAILDLLDPKYPAQIRIESLRERFL